MWYRLAQDTKREEYITFLQAEIPYLESLKEKYPRKAQHIDEIISGLRTKLDKEITEYNKPSDLRIIKPRTHNPNMTSPPHGFHDRLRHTTFDVLNQINNDALESYHWGVPLDIKGPLDRLYEERGEELRPYWNSMREELKARFGPTITLWRAEDIKQNMTDKPLSAYTNSRKVAEQFMRRGRKIVQREIPIDAIWGASRYVSDSGERPTEFWVENAKLV